MASDPERYATVAELARDLGVYVVDTETGADLTNALSAASDEIDRLTGLPEQAEYSLPLANMAARRLSARWYQRKDSPLGVMGGFTDMPLYVRGNDPDVDRFILGNRHTWPIG